MLQFSKKLIDWYLQNMRELPWRETQDPYRIWLSEIILQQTRVEQGLPYFQKFVAAYPNIKSLADAPEDKVLKHWQGLGYYSRARNLHASAKHVAYTLDGNFPRTYQEIKKLKGVGDYTASAIASICFGEPTAVVDGNVYRVLSRVFGIDTPIDSTSGKKEFKALAQELIDKKQPATFNQALMEFGATHCKPKKPYCLHCPFQEECSAFRSGEIDELPVKKGRTRVRDRYFNYVIIMTPSGETVIQQRGKTGIWRRLFEFPLLETQAEMDEEGFGECLNRLQLPGKSQNIPVTDIEITAVTRLTPKSIIHKLSHQKLHVNFWLLELMQAKGLQTIPFKDFKDYAVPRVIDRFMEDFDMKTFLAPPKV